MAQYTGEVRSAKINAEIKTFRNPNKVQQFLDFIEDFEGITWDENRPSFYVVYLNVADDEVGAMVDVGLPVDFTGL